MEQSCTRVAPAKPETVFLRCFQRVRPAVSQITVKKMKDFKFSENKIKKLPVPEKGRVIYYDEALPELGLTITSAGVKSFHVKGRINGKPVRPVIPNGKFPSMHPEQARKIARGMLADMARGINPIQAKRENVKAEALKKAEAVYSEITLGTVLKDFLDSKKLIHKPATVNNYNRYIKSELDFGVFLDKPLILITLEEILKVHNERGQKANQAIKALKTMFNFAMNAYEFNGQSIFTRNPVSKYESLGIKKKYNKRTGTLDGEDFEKWFAATEKLEDRRDREYILFLLFTGCRGGEVYEKLKWNMIDFNKHTYVLDNTKNRKDVELPLPEYIENLIKDRAGDNGETGKVFPQVYDDGQDILDFLEKKAGTRVTRHDLRRTFTTICEACEIPQSVIKQLLNHTRTSSDADVTNNYKQFLKVAAFREDKTDPVLAATRKIEKTILRVAKRFKGEVLEFSSTN